MTKEIVHKPDCNYYTEVVRQDYVCTCGAEQPSSKKCVLEIVPPRVSGGAWVMRIELDDGTHRDLLYSQSPIEIVGHTPEPRAEQFSCGEAIVRLQQFLDADHEEITISRDGVEGIVTLLYQLGEFKASQPCAACAEFVRLQQELCDLLDADVEGDSIALHSRIVAGLKAWKAEVELTTHKIITCGVAASHPDANLSRTQAYGGKWDSPQAQKVRELRDERDALRAAQPPRADQSTCPHELASITCAKCGIVMCEPRNSDGPSQPSGASLAEKIGEALIGGGFYDRMNDLTADDTPARIVREFLAVVKPIFTEHYGRSTPTKCAKYQASLESQRCVNCGGTELSHSGQ